MEISSKTSLFSLENVRRLFEDTTLPGFDVPDFGVRPASNASNRQTLIKLNKRLEDYLKKVKDLKEKNQSLQKEIHTIEAEKKVHHGRDWNHTQKILEDQELRIKTITEEIAKLTLHIRTTKLEKEDFERKLEEETRLSRKLEKELTALENIPVLQKQQQNLRSEIEVLKEEFQHQKKDHEANVKALCEKINESKVIVEIKSQNSNLAVIVKNIREKYDAIANRNMEEINNWYQREIEIIKEQEAHYLSQLKSEQSVLMNLQKEKKILEIQIETLTRKNASLKVTLEETKHQMGGYKENIAGLKKKLEELIAQIGEQQKKNQKLLDITGNLQEQIQTYKDLVDYNYERDASSLHFSD